MSRSPRTRNQSRTKEKVCKFCESTFRNRYSELFCNKECQSKFARLSWVKICPECKTEFSHNANIFCSHSCAGSFNNRLRNTKVRQCDFCGIEHQTTSKYQKFCSVVCNAAFKKRAKELEIEQGSVKSPSVIKEYIYKIRGRKCEICLITEWQGQPVPMILDHISGNSEDNSLENLRVVCPNCDAQLPTFKSKNKVRVINFGYWCMGEHKTLIRF